MERIRFQALEQSRLWWLAQAHKNAVAACHKGIPQTVKIHYSQMATDSFMIAEQIQKVLQEECCEKGN